MAKKVVTTTTLEDDLDGGTADETVVFAIDGTEYEIDLSKANAKELRDSILKFSNKARPIKRGRRTSTATVRNSAEDLAAIRTWARANGHEVSDRGRIAQPIQDAYHASK
ncbi:Lsr2 family protein [Subtercola sp. RTI3]|uniref:histone-like nucleoid-structuring protein Lsr2 n=1 Tax=Subtercola sp. RTI3 TaxID=3048639 RepID=UPI002B22579E|nr:Lsr2 family protein [Subtercola sp. RTI3]MEA9986266.1 Lsr2 family protein [Subtercola sp. RTI3]